MGITTKGSAFGPKWSSVFEMYNWQSAKSAGPNSINGCDGDVFVPPATNQESVIELGASSQIVELPGTRAREVIRAMADDFGGSALQRVNALRGEALRSEDWEDGPMKRYLGLFFGVGEDAALIEDWEDIEFLSGEMEILTALLLDEAQDPIVWRNAQLILDSFEDSKARPAQTIDETGVPENFDVGAALSAMAEGAFYSQICEYIDWGKLDAFAKYYGFSEELHELLIDRALTDYWGEVEAEVTAVVERAIADFRNSAPGTVAHRAATWLLEDIQFRDIPEVLAVYDAELRPKADDQE